MLWPEIIEWLARFILLGLVGLSIWSIAIILERRKFFSNFNSENEFKKIIANFHQSPHEVTQKETSRLFFTLKNQMQKGLHILGTLGSITPFIGLLGTILGIIVAFSELSQGQAGSNAVMFALAEALILTAVGLFVAIPAVIAFNLFNKKIKYFLGDIQSRIDDA